MVQFSSQTIPGFQYQFSKKHLRKATGQPARKELVCMTSCTVGSISKCEEVAWIYIIEPRKESCKTRSSHIANV